MKSIGAEMKNWQNENDDDEDDVSLFNHSDVSAFKRFRSFIPSTIIRASYHPMNTNVERKNVDVSAENEENLLTSEKTHFSPIMLDGHTFTIDNKWDAIKYERSVNGGLMHNNKLYQKWNNPNDFGDGKLDLDAMEDEAKEFTIKFLVKDENEKACQTDMTDFLRASNRSLLEINEEYCKRKIYDEYFKGVGEANNNNNNNKWRYHLNADDSNDYSFFSVNRVKNSNNNNLAPKTLQDILISSNSSSSSICTITSSSYEASPAVDPFESWRSMKVDGMMDADYKRACMHSLWEQCTTCTRNDYNAHEEKSIPANHLLKQELRMEGDEIMNVIQNLYITGDYCDDEEEKDDEDCEDMNHFYMDMLDDSMDGTGLPEDESKFYESVDGQKTMDEKGKKNLSPNLLEQHQLENFDEITMAKLQWQWDKTRETEKDQEKYLKLLKWIQTSLLKEEHAAAAADNNNNCQLSSEDRRPKNNNRKRRHSTCQQFMEKKTHRSVEHDFTYHLNLSQSPNALIEENANLFVDAAKMLKVNIEKILLIADDTSKDENGANYYRNILQQQHALIKQMDLARPLTR
jgi:hypothetical protein